jgi:hypothetical protein
MGGVGWLKYVLCGGTPKALVCFLIIVYFLFFSDNTCTALWPGRLAEPISYGGIFI